MAGDDVKIRISAEDQATATLRQLQSSIASFSSTVKGLAVAGLSFGVISKAIEFLADSFNKFAESEKALTKFQSVLRSTGNTIGLTSKQVQEFATARANLTTFDDDITIAAAAQLARFKNITGETFKETLAVAQDLATVMDTDLVSAAQNLGRALSNPEDGLKKLTKAGIVFSATEKELIKDMVKAGDVAGAQAKILAELNRQFGGAAGAEAKTTGGQIQQLKNAFGEFQESIGAVFAEGVMGIANAIKGAAGLPTTTEAGFDAAKADIGRKVKSNFMRNLPNGIGRLRGLVGERARLGRLEGDVAGHMAVHPGDDGLKFLQREIANQLANINAEINAPDMARARLQQERIQQAFGLQRKFGAFGKGAGNFLGGFDFAKGFGDRDLFGVKVNGPGNQILNKLDPRGGWAANFFGAIGAGAAGNGGFNLPKEIAKAINDPALGATESRFLTRGRGMLNDPQMMLAKQNAENGKKLVEINARMEKLLVKIEAGGIVLQEASVV